MTFSAKNRNRILFAVTCIWVAAIFLVYLSASVSGGQGDVLMPLDDTYIHFQYARQLAVGQPYQYNPGQPPTSGATSFLYPFVLAAGYTVGFHDLALGLWAMIVGALSLLASMLAVYRIAGLLEAPWQLVALAAFTFSLTGSFTWHFFSGMETPLMIALTLWTVVALLSNQPRWFAVMAVLLALIRPEGSIMAVTAGLIAFAFNWRTHRRYAVWFLLPILALAVQPIANLIFTGEFVASGGQAKSLLGLVPRDWPIIISRILDNWLRMWLEFMTGYAPREGWYLPIGLGPLAIVGLGFLAFSRQKNLRQTGFSIAIWLVLVTAAIATLDTAFWHFKRYQMPLMVLFVPLAFYALHRLLSSIRQLRPIILGYVAVFVPIFSVVLFAQFLNYFYVNITYVYAQPLQMARWLAENTPEDAVIAVHDVGMMRYMGGRTTLDIVGLTTPNAAAYWRNGPGSVAEFLIQEQSDYIASYGVGHGYGLRMLADTSLYANVLAEFPVDLQPHLNVALAADYQAIYQPDWERLLNRSHPPATVANFPDGFSLVSETSVADPSHVWSRSGDVTSFPSVVQQFACADYLLVPCDDLQTGRFVNWERLTVDRSAVSGDLLLVTRLHAEHPSQLEVWVGAPDTQPQYVATRVLPAIPGRWQDIPTLIPAEQLPDSNTVFVELRSTTGYESYTHWFYTGAYPQTNATNAAIATYQDSSFLLTGVAINSSSGQIGITFDWTSTTAVKGDLRFFVHVYDDLNQPPVAQWDGYLPGGPVGNWLPGTRRDTVMVNLHELTAGSHTLAIGFYDPNDPQQRPVPTSDHYDVLPDGRLILGEIVTE